jgi:hypothetical protein
VQCSAVSAEGREKKNSQKLASETSISYCFIEYEYIYAASHDVATAAVGFCLKREEQTQTAVRVVWGIKNLPC